MERKGNPRQRKLKAKERTKEQEKDTKARECSKEVAEGRATIQRKRKRNNRNELKRKTTRVFPVWRPESLE